MATEAYTTSSTWLRTGPDTNFPPIERVPRGSIVDVYGCTDGYDWCDVDHDGERGWFPGGRLQFIYNGRRGSISSLAPFLGLMILQFRFQDYWDNYYRDRSWYNDRNRQRWQNWQPRTLPFMNQQSPRRQGPVAPQNVPLQQQPPAVVNPTPQQNMPSQPRRPPSPVQPLNQGRPAAPAFIPNSTPTVTPNAAPVAPQLQLQPERPPRIQQPNAPGQQAPQPGIVQPKKKACLPPEICN